MFTVCVPLEVCLAGGVCRYGHTGPRCENCKPGYYKKGGNFCTRCPPSKEIIFPVVAVLAVLGCVGLLRLARRSSHYFAPLTVGLSFLQVVALMPSFEPRWPPWVSTVCRAFSLTNIDLSLFFEPQCMVSNGSSQFVRVWLFKAAIPLLIVAMFSLFGLAGLCYYVISNLKPYARRYSSMSPAQLQRFALMCLNSGVTCLTISYVTVSQNALIIFPCSKQADGRLTLDADPAIECRSPIWRTMALISVVTLFFFSLCLPLGLALILFVYRYDLWRQKLMLVLGMVFKRYRSELFYFESVNMARKFVFVLGIVLFKHNTAGPMVWALVVCLVASAYTAKLKPFVDSSVTQLEIMAQASSSFILVLGLAFYFSSRKFNPNTASTLGSVIVMVIWIMLCLIVWGIIRSWRVQRDLVRRGVRGLFGADGLVTQKAFFDLDVHIIDMSPIVDAPHCSVWRIALTTRLPVRMTVSMCQLEIGLGASRDEVSRSLMIDQGEVVRRLRKLGCSAADSADLMEQYSARTSGASMSKFCQAHTVPDGQTTYFNILLPCRGVYSAQINTTDCVVAKFAVAADVGSAPVFTLAGPSSVFLDGSGVLLSPVESHLVLGTRRTFSLRLPAGISEAVVTQAGVLDASQGVRMFPSSTADVDVVSTELLLNELGEVNVLGLRSDSSNRPRTSTNSSAANIWLSLVSYVVVSQDELLADSARPTFKGFDVDDEFGVSECELTTQHDCSQKNLVGFIH